MNRYKSDFLFYIAIVFIFGFFYWIADSFIDAYCSAPLSFDVVFQTFCLNLISKANLYSSLLAIILLLILSMIFYNKKNLVLKQNNRLFCLKEELVKSNTKLKEILFKDQLTGAINRIPFIELEHKKILEAERNNKKIAFLFADLSNFKNINDLHGHQTGDTALCFAVVKMHECIRKTDFVGRYGGDEFILCLYDIKHRDNIYLIINKIESVFLEKIKIKDNAIELKVNIGA